MKKNIRPIFFYIIFFVFILSTSKRAISFDYDLWARLIAGMGFVQTGHVLKQDFLSYTPSHVWFDHEWGSSVIFYLTQHLFSGAGLLVLQSILIFSIFVFIIKIIKLRGLTTSAYNFLFYFFAFQSMVNVLNQPIRCQLFSFLLFTVFLYILELSRKGENRPLWLIPFIMIFWNNAHGGCISGIGLILIYIIGEFLNKKPYKKYIYTLISSVLVLLLNPWGFDYLGFLLIATTMKRPDIMEWWGLFSSFHMNEYLCFKFFVPFVLLAESIVILKSVREKTFKLDATKFLVIFVTLILAIKHVKMVPFAVISITCFLYDDFYTLFNSWLKNTTPRLNFLRECLIYWIIIVFCFVTLRSGELLPALNWAKYPLREVEFLKINNINGKLMTNFGIGSYVAYKLYPNNTIFMDGRYEEVYYDYMMPLLKKFYLVKPGWDEVITRFPPDVMIIEKYYPVFETLKAKKDWTLIFLGEYYGVFIKTKDIKDSYKLPSYDLKYYQKTLFDTNINFMLQSKHE